jgi:hypothetical protein
MGSPRLLFRSENHLSNMHHPTLPKFSFKRTSLTCRMSASSGGEGAGEGDKLLAGAATALANGDLNEAMGFIVAAKEAYRKVRFF